MTQAKYPYQEMNRPKTDYEEDEQKLNKNLIGHSCST